MKELVLLLVDVGFYIGSELLYMLLYAVDAVIGDAKVAIEIKSVEEVKTRHKNGLKAFHEEHPDCRLILVSLEPVTRKVEDIELIYVLDFLKMLWNGEIF